MGVLLGGSIEFDDKGRAFVVDRADSHARNAGHLGKAFLKVQELTEAGTLDIDMHFLDAGLGLFFGAGWHACRGMLAFEAGS